MADIRRLPTSRRRGLGLAAARCRAVARARPCSSTPTASGARRGRAARPPPRPSARTCPVIEACLKHALSVREPYGVWGGMSEEERTRLLAAEPARVAARCSPPQAEGRSSSCWTGPRRWWVLARPPVTGAPRRSPGDARGRRSGHRQVPASGRARARRRARACGARPRRGRAPPREPRRRPSRW